MKKEVEVKKVIELADAYVLHYAEHKRFIDALMEAVKDDELKESNDKFEDPVSGKKRKNSSIEMI